MLEEIFFAHDATDAGYVVQRAYNRFSIQELRMEGGDLSGGFGRPGGVGS
jgi:hypothetical protein